MPSASEIKQRVAIETERRARLGVPAFAAGFLYVISGVIIGSALKGAPTVGLLQGISPALQGVANPAVSPRAPEVKFISHHAFALIAGSVLAAIAIGILTVVLLFLVDATRFRRPETWAPARRLVLFGGLTVALISVGHQVVGSIQTHNFAVGHDFSNHAVEKALTTGTANLVTEYLDLLAGLTLAVGMIVVMINAMRTGLITRWMGVLGIFTAILLFLPLGGATLEVIPGFWLVMMGILYTGRWPKGDLPAWTTGEARPWPSQADMRAQREAEKDGSKANGAKGKSAQSQAGTDVAPEPRQPATSRSRKRRRKGGARP